MAATNNDTSKQLQKQLQHIENPRNNASARGGEAALDPIEQIYIKLSKLPIQTQHPHLLQKCRPIIQSWHDQFSVSDPLLWNRMRKAIPKELNESAFIIAEMMNLLGTADDDGDGKNNATTFEEDTEMKVKRDDIGGKEIQNQQLKNYKLQPYTIIDMCSGVGYLSMFLSHLLKKDSCSRIVPIDTLFELNDRALAGVTSPQNAKDDGNKDHNSNNEILQNKIISDDDNSQKQKQQQQFTSNDFDNNSRNHLSTNHLTTPPIPHPIPIHPRKANIKRSRELRQISQHIVNKSPGPTILLGVHLCKALSVHTVRLFNENERIERMYLKPCCLPGKGGLRLRDPPFWRFDHMRNNGSDGDGLGNREGGFGIETLYCVEVSNAVGNGECSGTSHGNSAGRKNNNPRALKKMGREEKKKEERELLASSKQYESNNRDDDDEDDNIKENHELGNKKGGGGAKGNALFDRWTNLLCRAVDTTSRKGVSVETHHISVQKRHFQNKYIVAIKE